MMDVLRRIIGFGEDPTKVLKEKLDQGQEGVTWVATPAQQQPDLSDLTPEEFSKLDAADKAQAFEIAIEAARISKERCRFIGPDSGITLQDYDPDLARLRLRLKSGQIHVVEAYWIADTTVSKAFDHLREIDWSVSLSPERGKGMRPALLSRGFAARHGLAFPSWRCENANEYSASNRFFAARRFAGVDDALTLDIADATKRHFLCDLRGTSI